MNSPTTDLIIRVKNGYLAQKLLITGIYSKLNERILEILNTNKYIESFEVEEEGNKKKFLIHLRYVERKPAVTDVKLVSKPGRKMYSNVKEIPGVRGGMGITILTTSKGVMTDSQARQSGVGGQVLCQIW